MTNNNESKKPPSKPGISPACEIFRKAITDLVLNEDMAMPKEELFIHLKECAECRKYLSNWQDVCNVFRMDAFSRSPEGKAKMEADLARVKAKIQDRDSRQAMQDSINDQKMKEGLTEVRKCLGENGPMPIWDLPQKCNMNIFLALTSFGALWEQKKAKFSNTDAPNVISLTDDEQHRYMEETGQLGQI